MIPWSAQDFSIREQVAESCRLRQLRAEAGDFVAHKRIDRRAKQLVRLIEACTSFGAVPTCPREERLRAYLK